jgi:hypothetical protein
MRYIASPIPAAIAATCLFGTLSPAHATADMALNTSGFVAGQPSTLSVDGVITGTSSPLVITGACVELRFDPTKVTISNLRTDSSTGWELLAYNTDNTADGWIRTAMFNNLNPGQTTTGPILLFTVTPANSSVNVNDCDTLRFSGSESDFCDDGFYDYIPSDPCAGIMSPPGQETETTTTLGAMTMGMSSGASSSSLVMPSCEDFQSAARILRIMGGLTKDLSGDPNLLLKYPPLTQQNQATLETVDLAYLLIAPRRFTWQDVLAAVRLPSTGPSEAVWTKSFIGNTLDSCGKAANSTGMPAVSLLNPQAAPSLSNPWIAAFPMGTIDGTNYFPGPDRPVQISSPSRVDNTNAVYLLSDMTGNGGYGIRTNWDGTQKLTDAPSAPTLAAFQPGDPVRVFSNTFQDEESWAAGDFGLFSRLYAWNVDGSGTAGFASTGDPTNPNARGMGHASTIAAPLVYDINGDGTNEIIFATQGQTDNNSALGAGEYGGAIQFLKPDGSMLTDSNKVPYVTQTLDPSSPWYALDGPDLAEFEAPPVLGKVHNSTDRFIVGAALAGTVYAWSKTGTMLPGFPVFTDLITAKNSPLPPATPVDKNLGLAVLDSAPAVADVDGDSHTEIIAAAGRGMNYAYDTSFYFPPNTDDPLYGFPFRYWDGFIYCWKDTGGDYYWRYPQNRVVDWNGNMNGMPAFESGVAVGRLGRSPTDPSQRTPPAIVSVDASGRVVALKGELDNTHTDSERELWWYQLPQGTHRYFHGVVAQPLILDVNNDGYQDVIIGTLSGKVYILDGRPPTPPSKQGRLLAQYSTPFHTFRSSDSVWKQENGDPPYTPTHVEEQQYEEIRGMAVAPLNINHQDHAILLVTSGRAALTIYASQVGGHAMLFDLGPNSWNSSLADWTQYQQNAQKTGYLPSP